MRYYLAVDIGASAGRHILAHIEGGKIIAEEIYRFSNTPEALPGTPGALGCQGGKRLMWNAKRLFREILNGLKKAGELGKAPYSVGVDTWGVDYVLLDEKDEPIGGVYCYRDGRTKSAVASVHRRVPFAELYAKTGIQFQAFNTVYQLYDDKRTGRSAKARSFLMLPDYFHFLLTGVKKQEYTNATTTGMVNALTHTWDEEIIEKLDYKKEWFGELAQPGTEAGEFRRKWRRSSGIGQKSFCPPRTIRRAPFCRRRSRGRRRIFPAEPGRCWASSGTAPIRRTRRGSSTIPTRAASAAAFGSRKISWGFG